MSDHYSIQIENVSKMYKMYKSNLAKITDLLGISFKKNYEEFWPLKEINLTIKKGEKVGIIGRNGAGKTTLLSMIADNTKPTSGTIRVKGQVNALFVLGTGFHPEFSGRENIYASLAFQGITGKEAKSMEYEIIEFSELEDFIDQPVKTYSAGMYARLAFTVATAIRPEVLIIDEVLGAGDAYFASKALERMKELTSGGTTVLFVSHDLSSVQQMCERCIWIDRGKVREDGDTLSVLKAYSADVRKREEQRLQKKNKLQIQEESPERQLIFRFIGEDGAAPKKGLPLHRIALSIKGEKYAEIFVGDSMDNSIQEGGYITTDKQKINWSEPIKYDRKWYREYIDLGRTNVHAAGVFILPQEISLIDMSFDVEYLDTCDKNIALEVYDEHKCVYIPILMIENTASNELKIIDSTSTSPGLSISNLEYETNDVYGSKEIVISDYFLANEKNEKKYVFHEKEKICIHIPFEVSNHLEKNPYFGYSVFDFSGKLIDNYFIDIDVNQKGKYLIKVGLKNTIFLRKNKYLLSIAFYKSIDLFDNSKAWEAYIVLDRKIEFTIESDSHIAIPLGIIDLQSEITLSSIEA